MSRSHRNKGDDDALSFVVWALLIIFLMPFAGLYFLLKKDHSMRWLGWILLIVGIVLWVIIGANA